MPSQEVRLFGGLFARCICRHEQRHPVSLEAVIPTEMEILCQDCREVIGTIFILKDFDPRGDNQDFLALSIEHEKNVLQVMTERVEVRIRD